jgi:hypothetical protein
MKKKGKGKTEMEMVEEKDFREALDPHLLRTGQATPAFRNG